MLCRWNLPKTALLAGVLLVSAAVQAQEAPPSLVGLNVAGPAFAPNELPGKHGTNYFFPPPDYFAKWQARGISWVRFSIQWERLQPEAFGELDEDYAQRIGQTFDEADHYGIQVMLDVHNYGRYYRQLVGKEVPIAAYADLMERIAKRWGEHPALYAYDLMNEPYGEAGDYWLESAQAGIDAVRLHDRENTIYVEGRSWSSSERWPKYNDDLATLRDPADNLVFSAHLYADKDSSGRYKERSPEQIDPMLGVKRVKPFVEWLARHGLRGHIGEFGIPAEDPRWLEVMDNMLAYLREQCIPVAYWAAGSHWGRNYFMSVEPVDGVDRPQWSVLQKYLGSGDCKAIGPQPSPSLVSNDQ